MRAGRAATRSCSAAALRLKTPRCVCTPWWAPTPRPPRSATSSSWRCRSPPKPRDEPTAARPRERPRTAWVAQFELVLEVSLDPGGDLADVSRRAADLAHALTRSEGVVEVEVLSVEPEPMTESEAPGPQLAQPLAASPLALLQDRVDGVAGRLHASMPRAPCNSIPSGRSRNMKCLSASSPNGISLRLTPAG